MSGQILKDNGIQGQVKTIKAYSEVTQEVDNVTTQLKTRDKGPLLLSFWSI